MNCLMNRNNLERVNNLMGKLRRLEAGVKAIIHDSGESYLHVRKGNTDLETGILLSKDHILAALKKDIDDHWVSLEALGVERGLPYDPSTMNSLAKLFGKAPEPSTPKILDEVTSLPATKET